MADTLCLTKDKILALPFKKARYDVPDGFVPNLFVRVGAKTKKYVLFARFAGSKNPSRKTIGAFPKMTLDAARAIAFVWNEKAALGIDPKAEIKATEREKLLEQRQTFGSAVRDYMAWLPGRPRNRHVKADIATLQRHVLNTPHSDILAMHVSAVTDVEIATIIVTVHDRPAPRAALTVFTLLQGFFLWVTSPLRKREYGITRSPLLDTKPSQLELSRRSRSRILRTHELRAYFRAADETPYPYGPFYKGVVFMCGRKSDLANSRWSEIDWRQKLWTIPAERDKNGQEHLIPLSKQMIALFKVIELEQGAGHGDFIFSTTHGHKPINGLSKSMGPFKDKVEAILEREAPAPTKGDWVLHDTRRVARTGLAALKVDKTVAGLIVGHRKKGIEAVYDQHEYVPEMRAALSAYAAKVEQIVDGSAEWFSVDNPDAE